MKLHCIMIMFFKEYYYYYNYYYHIHIYIYIEIPKHTEQCFQDGLLMMFSLEFPGFRHFSASFWGCYMLVCHRLDICIHIIIEKKG